MNTILTKLSNGDILDSFYSPFNHMIVSRKYTPVIDEYGDLCAPFGKNIIIDKILAPTKNIYLISEFVEKRHKLLLQQFEN